MLGSLPVRACFGGNAYCGHLMRKLDPGNGLTNEIPIAFAWFPHRQDDIAASGTIVAVDGGPGYSSIGSSDDFRALFGSLLDSHDLLIVDNRGTGRSEAIVCPELQAVTRMTLTAVDACGRRLGQAAYAYRSSLAADDLDAVLQAVGAGPVDLYGDSYGTYFAEVFAYRHPADLRTLVLDSAYPAANGDPWWPEGAATLTDVLQAACSRSNACANQAIKPADRLRQLLAVGQLPAGLSTADLAGLSLSGAIGPVFLREINAAMAAWLQDRDDLPLVRLVNESQIAGAPSVIDPKPRIFSAGLFVAVSCGDYPQLYDMHLDRPHREAALDMIVARQQHDRPDNYAPFSIADMRASSLQENTIDLCLSWPVAPPSLVTGKPLLGDDGKDLPPPSVPTLILSGELDIGTTVREGVETAALFPRATHVVLRNSFHASALDVGNPCAVALVRDFVTMTRLADKSCADMIASVQLLSRFFLTVNAVPAAMAEDGTPNEPHDLRLANAAALTAQDLLARWWSNPTGSGSGLRGGHYRFESSSENRVTLILHKVRWVTDLAVSGRLTWDRQSGDVKGRIDLDGDDDDDGSLELHWNTARRWSHISLKGNVNGHRLAAMSYDD
jgi:pimeloyl-ACP methyl ester carboxylesterase